ncbi:MAG: hypothetical protein ACQEXJ_11280 [Myxococcota bacterium]
MTRAIAAAAVVVLLSAAPAAHADRYDLDLSRFATAGSDGGLVVDEAGFGRMSRDLGMALRPRFAGPADTSGALGFVVDYGLSLTDVDETAGHWTTPVDDPGNTLAVSRLSLRKGLPWSFELGGTLTHLHDSSIWGVGMDVKWAFVEGLRNAPDVGLRLHVTSVLGSRDLSMLMAGGDFVLSKTFGVGGLLQLTPYAGYSGTYIRATSHVLGRFEAGDLEPETFIIDDQHIDAHRATLGLRVVASVVDMAFETALGKDAQTYSFRLGLTF